MFTINDAHITAYMSGVLYVYHVFIEAERKTVVMTCFVSVDTHTHTHIHTHDDDLLYTYAHVYAYINLQLIYHTYVTFIPIHACMHI